MSDTPSIVQYVATLAIGHAPELVVTIDGEKNVIKVMDWQDAHRQWTRDGHVSLAAAGQDIELQRVDGAAMTINDYENVIDIIAFNLEPMSQDVPERLRSSLAFRATAFWGKYEAIKWLRSEILMAAAGERSTPSS